MTSWNDAEDSALQGLPLAAQVLYLRGLRQYMDFSTGEVGVRRGVSLKSLSEVLFVEPIAGLKTKALSRDQIYRLCGQLERAGLVVRRSIERERLVFFLPLAVTDKSVQNKAATWPRHGRNSQAATEAATEEFNDGAASRDMDATQAATWPQQSPEAQAATPPLSGIYSTQHYAREEKIRSPEGSPLTDDCIPKQPLAWSQFFLQERGFPMHVVQTAKTIPLFANWCERGVSVGLIRRAMAAAEAWKGGPVGSPVLYGRFLESILTEAARIAADQAAREQAIKTGEVYGNPGGGSGGKGDLWAWSRQNERETCDWVMRALGHGGSAGTVADVVSERDGAGLPQSGHGGSGCG